MIDQSTNSTPSKQEMQDYLVSKMGFAGRDVWNLNQNDLASEYNKYQGMSEQQAMDIKYSKKEGYNYSNEVNEPKQQITIHDEQYNNQAVAVRDSYGNIKYIPKSELDTNKDYLKQQISLENQRAIRSKQEQLSIYQKMNPPETIFLSNEPTALQQAINLREEKKTQIPQYNFQVQSREETIRTNPNIQTDFQNKKIYGSYESQKPSEIFNEYTLNLPSVLEYEQQKASSEHNIFKAFSYGSLALGTGVTKGLIEGVIAPFNPNFYIGTIKLISNPIESGINIGEQLMIKPISTIGEFYGFGKGFYFDTKIITKNIITPKIKEEIPFETYDNDMIKNIRDRNKELFTISSSGAGGIEYESGPPQKFNDLSKLSMNPDTGIFKTYPLGKQQQLLLVEQELEFIQKPITTIEYPSIEKLRIISDIRNVGSKLNILSFSMQNSKQLQSQFSTQISIQKPIQNTIQLPKQISIQKPIQNTIQLPKQISIQKPIQIPVQSPILKSTESPFISFINFPSFNQNKRNKQTFTKISKRKLLGTSSLPVITGISKGTKLTQKQKKGLSFINPYQIRAL